MAMPELPKTGFFGGIDFGIPVYTSDLLECKKRYKKKWWQRWMPFNWNPVGKTLGEAWLEDLTKDYYEVGTDEILLVDPSKIKEGLGLGFSTSWSQSIILNKDLLSRLKIPLA